MMHQETGSMSSSSQSPVTAPPSPTNLNNDSQSQRQRQRSSFHLRWSRLTKTVHLTDENKGLMRGSVAVSMGGGGPSSNNKSSRDLLQEASSASSSSTKNILNQVSGSAAPGQVLALMGPSGSGKTSLLNALSGRTTYQSGNLSINGTTLTPQAKKRLLTKIAYVKQADIFFSHLSVRDQLTYTALLRLPQEWPTPEKLEEVEKILEMLRLTNVAESPIHLLSGGEKKRTNIGTELLTDPSVLLLDEPTSGLDSTSAVSLLQMLQNLAKQHQKTVITSIHQPSSKVFFSFDKLMMLAQGNVVYFGTPRHSLEYLREVNLCCPDGYNAADHWMDLLVNQNNNSTSSSSSSTKQVSSSLNNTTLTETTSLSDVEDNVIKPANQLLIEAWDNESIAVQVDEDAEKHQQETAALLLEQDDLVGEHKKKKKFSKYNTSWAMQYRILVHRALKNSRSAIFTPINLVKSAALGVMVGLLYFQMPYTESSVFDRNSFFFFAMTYWVFDAMFNAMMAFPMERTVILKERSSGAYHLSAYFMAKTTSEMPMRMALPAIYMTISFWMAGISPKISLFLLTTLISLLSVIAGESIGLMIGASIYDMEKAMTTMTVLSLGLMLLGGFFIENVPSWLLWGKYLSPFKYSFDASRQLVFDRPVPCDGSGALESLCLVGSSNNNEFASSEEVVEALGVQGSVLFNALMLLVIGLVPRYIAYLALRAKKENDR
mmetsp:Transcript_36183/g.87541  ORF Transcript_36183/g.87541 Transcript_36183/m.87541 type:complete len:716 (-) Transcript_36183:248-2395(-)|eukprot:CAMPEP_0113638150 /NCGR_PEP_ID=MMETSP0017_2-20120614/19977_1 /TAXON_ID=2856 /ORGANISM="Cylindrotheca closterium" /LENGTH=715 /DNA_ID=CAMNT_0000549227 /DNA_START=193 /DNA_END=2340 /DNA_ORIENTATION=- /assembly_acc=CAM_ASM_000147